MAALGLVVALHAAAAGDAIDVGGAVARPIAFDVESLHAFPPETATYGRGEGASTPTTVRGARLAAVVEAARPLAADRNAWKRTVVVAVARDGYRVVFSWAELVNTAVGDGVLIVYERDGRPLDAAEGPIALVSTRDTRTGPRSVKWLVRLDVRVVDD